MIRLSDLPRNRVDEVLHLVLPEGQVDFVGEITEMVADPLPKRDFHAAYSGPEAVAFFKIDRDYAPSHDFARPDGWGLRGFLVGGQYQGRGLGRAVLCALPRYLSDRYPGQRLYYLTVNCRNTRAFRTYLQAGWRDEGGLYLQGRAGPHHILRLDLP